MTSVPWAQQNETRRQQHCDEDYCEKQAVQDLGKHLPLLHHALGWVIENPGVVPGHVAALEMSQLHVVIMHSFVDDVGVGVIVVATVVMRPPVNFVSSLRRQYVLYLHHLGGVPVQIGDGRRSVVVGAFPHARGSHAFVLQPEAASDVLDEQNVGPARHAARAAAVVKVEDHHAEADGQRAQGHRHAEVQHCKRHGS